MAYYVYILASDKNGTLYVGVMGWTVPSFGIAMCHAGVRRKHLSERDRPG